MAVRILLHCLSTNCFSGQRSLNKLKNHVFQVMCSFSTSNSFEYMLKQIADNLIIESELAIERILHHSLNLFVALVGLDCLLKLHRNRSISSILTIDGRIRSLVRQC